MNCKSLFWWVLSVAFFIFPVSFNVGFVYGRNFRRKKKNVEQWLQSFGYNSQEIAAIVELINIPQGIASLFVQIISAMVLIQS